MRKRREREKRREERGENFERRGKMKRKSAAARPAEHGSLLILTLSSSQKSLHYLYHLEQNV